nr:retrovirus-related Pol polyprotein from transposon TNT 1-94 [Tanacetum cinerariifolium]
MLNKENYVPWSSRLLWYAKSRPNGKLIHNSILNGTYVRKMIPKPGDANRDITITETFHLQTDDELSNKELKQIKADDQAIQTILLGLPEDIYAAEKKAKLFNEWERFTSNEGESIESYSYRFLKLMNDLKTNKHFPEKIASNLKFLNNLQPEWSRHVTIVHQTKDLHTADYTQLYDFLKYNHNEVDELKAERIAKTQDPLALMANSNNPYVFPAPHQDQSSFNQNYLQQPMLNPEDITDPTTAISMVHALMAKTFKLNYSTPTNNNQRISSNPRNMQIAQPGNPAGYNDVFGNQVNQNAVQNPRVQNVRNQNGLICVQGNGNQNQIGNGNLVAARAEGNAAGQNGNQIRCYNCRGVGHYARNCIVRPRRRDAAYLQTQLLITQKEEAGIQLQVEEYDLMAAVADSDEIEEVNANCILMANLQQASTSGTQTDSTPVYDTDGSAENDNDVISEDTSVEQGGETVEQHPVNFEETRALYESLYHNLAIEVKKEAAKFVGDFKSIANEADASLAKHKALELEIKRLLKAVVSQDIMIIVQNESVVDTSDLYTELERTKERFENCIIKKETKYAKLWNDWYKKCDECKYDKISYDKAYKDMQQKFKRLQAQLGDLKGKSKDTSSVSDTRNPLSQKLKNKNVELEFQVVNYARENSHLKATYKNLFDSLSVSHAETKTIIASLQNELQSNIYKNAKLRTQLFKKVSDQKDNTQDTSANTKFAKQPVVENLPKVGKSNALSKQVTSNSVSTPQEPKRIDNTKTRRPQPRSNTKNDRVPSASKSSRSQNKEAKVEEHHRNLLLSKNNKQISSACNNIKIDSQDVISKVVCATCLKCLISVNHDKCLSKNVNGKNSCRKNQKAKVSVKEIQKKYQPNIAKPKKVGTHESIATPKSRKPRFLLRWSPTRKMFDKEGKIVDSSKSKTKSACSNGDNACTSNTMKPKIKRFPNSTSLLDRLFRFVYDASILGCSKHMTGNLKLLINFIWKFMGTVRFGNDHVDAILGFVDLQWGNILITRVYFVEGLGHNLFLVGQFCDSDLEVAFRRDACFLRNLEGVDLLKGDRSTNLYTINLHEMSSASPICLMAHTSSTKSWLWHQRLSHLNFDTINDLARNDLVVGLPKFKYHKEHLCPSCEQGKRKRASHPPKPVPNLRQRLHLLHIDLCGPMRIASINGKRYVLVIVDDYSRYTWVHFLRSKDEAPEVIIKLLKRITAIATACFTQNRFNKTPYELINGRKLDISFLHVFGALCYPKNDREDIGKLGAKGDIGFFIRYSADSCANRVFNHRTKKIMETMNVSFYELSAMAFEQRSSKPGLNSMTSGHISSGLDLTYAPSTIIMQQPLEGELDLLFEAMYDDYIGSQPLATARTVSPAQEPQVCQSSTASTTIADNVPIPTNSSSIATNILITS